MPETNLYLVSSISYLGNTCRKMKESIDILHLKMFESTTFDKIQKSVLLLIIHKVCQCHQRQILNSINFIVQVWVDGKCNSLSHSSKYMVFTLWWIILLEKSGFFFSSCGYSWTYFKNWIEVNDEILANLENKGKKLTFLLLTDTNKLRSTWGIKEKISIYRLIYGMWVKH